jgi:hypothetical protein
VTPSGERELPAHRLTTEAQAHTTLPAVAELRHLRLARSGAVRD